MQREKKILSEERPDLMQEWDYENNDKAPNQYSLHSNKKAHWICPNGHRYEAVINNRANGSKCPYCSGRKRIEGENDFYSWCFRNNKALLDEWDEENNKTICSPKKISVGSHYNVSWICQNGHTWKAEIRDRVKGRNCPYCNGTKVIKGENDFATIHPELLDEWDYEKNTFCPDQISSGSSKKAWWSCKKCGHKWQAVINNRVKGAGCPICAKAKRIVSSMTSKTDESLAYLFPELLKEWDYEKNTINPETTHPGTSRKAWWICLKCGNSYYSSIGARKQGNGCPVCAGKVIIPGFNDLRTWATINNHEYLLKEWDYEKNDLKPEKVAPHSNKKYWFICKRGHSYKAQLANRAKNDSGCPVCEKIRKTSFPEQAILFYVRKEFADAENSFHAKWLGKLELDIYIPSIDTAIEYDGKAWHSNSKKDQKKTDLCKEKNVRLIRVREEGLDAIDDCITINISPDIKGALDCAVKQLLNLLGIESLDVDVERDTGQIVQQYDLTDKSHSISNLFPELLSEWDYEKNGKVSPEYVNYGSMRKYWWKCSICGNEWLMSPNARTNQKQGCPICSAVKKGESLKRRHVDEKGSLFDNRKDVLDEWDYEKNTVSPKDISSGSRSRVWWKCSKCKGSYITAVYNKTKDKPTKCPYCSGEKVLVGYNDFATVHPELLEEWDYKKNEEMSIYPTALTSGSRMKVYWKCKHCSYEWQATIGDRSRGSGCPICVRKKLAKGQQKKVTNIETGQTFDSVNEAAAWASISPSTLVGHLKGGRGTAAGYHWKYAE